MEDFTIARIIHILGVVIWIGGVPMVTTVIIPAVRKMAASENPIATFEKIEGRFALQAKITTLLTGLSGFYMLYLMNAWHWYLDLRYWYLHAMTLVWLIFTVILFILEPFVLHRNLKKYKKKNSEKLFRFIHRAHWVPLGLSILIIIGAVGGSHGLFFSEFI